MKSITLSSKYQIVIPKEVREQMDLKPGQKFQVFAMNGQIRLVPVMPIEKLRGMFKDVERFVERGDDRY